MAILLFMFSMALASGALLTFRCCRIAQLKEEIRGYEAQQVSKDEQIDWIKKELAGVNALWQKNLIPYTRVTSLERDRVRLEGEREQLIANIAQARGKITETELQIIQ